MPVVLLEPFVSLLSKMLYNELAKAETLFASNAVPLACAIPAAEAMKAK